MIPFDDDELRQRLFSLGSDLDQVRLPGPRAARKRAAQRTRHQITTGVAAGVAVVAVGGMGLFQVIDSPNRASPEDFVATAPSQEPTTPIPDMTTPIPDTTPTPDMTSPIPADLLSDDQVSPIGAAGDFASSAGDVDDTVENLNVNGCVDDASGAETWRGSWTNGLDATFAETILQFGSAAEATSFAEDHAARSEETCAVETGDMFVVTNTHPDTLDAGDAAYTWTVSFTPAPHNPGSSTSFFATGVASRGNVVVVLTFGAMDDPLGDGWTTYMQERLADALDAATGR